MQYSLKIININIKWSIACSRNSTQDTYPRTQKQLENMYAHLCSQQSIYNSENTETIQICNTMSEWKRWGLGSREPGQGWRSMFCMQQIPWAPFPRHRETSAPHGPSSMTSTQVGRESQGRETPSKKDFLSPSLHPSLSLPPSLPLSCSLPPSFSPSLSLPPSPPLFQILLSYKKAWPL